MRGQTKVLSAFAVLAACLILGVTLASATAPVVSIDAPSAITYTSAHVSGHVNPEGSDTYYSFETSADGGATWSGFGFEGLVAAAAGSQSVSANLTGLKPGVPYLVRLVGKNFVDPEGISAEQSFSTDPVGSPDVSIDAPSAVVGSTVHFSGSINPQAPEVAPTTPAVEAGFGVKWHFQCTPACPSLTGTLAADDTAHAIEADATGLLANTPYEVSLVAENSAGPVVAGPESFATPAIAPEVKSTTSNPLSTEARLEAQINPGGLATTYHFEYGPSGSYGQATAEKTIAAGSVPVKVNSNLLGLSPNTGYHFRVVASNSVGMTDGSDQTFTTLPSEGSGSDSCPNAAIRAEQHATFLPECRAYEQVSAVDKETASVQFGPGVTLSGPTQISDNGDAAIYNSFGSFANSTGGVYLGYRARRTAGGWTSEFVSPPLKPTSDGVNGGAVALATPDLSDLFFSTTETPNPEDLDGRFSDVYLRNPNGAFEWRSGGNPQTPADPQDLLLDAVSPDGIHAIFSDRFAHVDPAVGPSQDPEAINIYDGTPSGVKLVSVDNDGALLDTCGVAVATAPSQNGGQGDPSTGISSDATTVVMKSSPFCPAGTLGLFARVDNSRTVEVSRSQRTPPEPQTSAPEFQWLSRDGSQLLFQSRDLLTNDAVDPESTHLYLYDFPSGDLTLVGPNFPSGNPQVFGLPPVVLGSSEDGSRIYLSAFDKLTADAQEGMSTFIWNIYVLVNGVPHFIAAGNVEGQTTENEAWGGRQGIYVSPDGSELVFATDAFRGDGVEPSFGTPGMGQLYQYTLASGNLACLSCAKLVGVPLKSPSSGISVMADGAVFFQTKGALVSRDTNEAMDVYENRDGRNYLLSTGQSSYGEYLANTDASGRNVLLGSVERLAASDRDGGMDLYDVRVDGGFSGTPRRRECEAEGCQPEGGPGPLPKVPGSSRLHASPHRLKPGRSSLRVMAAKTVKGPATSLSVFVPRQGALMSSGELVDSARKKSNGPQRLKIRVSLTSKGRQKLSRDGTVSTQVVFMFRAPGQGPIRAHCRVTFRKQAQR